MYSLTTYGSFFGELCSRDPYFYQACQKSSKVMITNNEMLCGQYLCSDADSSYGRVRLNVDKSSIVCNGIQDCKNTNLDEAGCIDMVTLISGKSVPSKEVCDGLCFDYENCEDEAVCNGHTYGVYCDFNPTTNTSKYVPVLKVCDNSADCEDGTDEQKCDLTNNTLPTCLHETDNPMYNPYSGWRSYNSMYNSYSFNYVPYARGLGPGRGRYNSEPRFLIKLIPVQNYTRCYATQKRASEGYIEYCKNNGYQSDQTNCTDPDKVALTCQVNGYNSTVSKHMLCFGKQVCDDNFENNCIRTSETCLIHKHYICDGKEDCSDGTDENQPFCNEKTNLKCTRRVGRGEAGPIPLIWLNDGVKDCIDGRDETSGWSTCGEGSTLRFVTHDSSSCENVFVCQWEQPGYVEFENLCDGIETCGNENKVCSESLGTPELFTVPMTTNRGLSKHLSFCKDGLKQTQNFMADCMTVNSFFHPHRYVFGVDNTSVTLPIGLQNCDHMFGEMYVYTSCTGKCINSSCPLKNVPRYEVCPDQFKDRIGTIANNSYLEFVTKKFGNIFTNYYFVCDNKVKCIDYSQVCNLVNDCGDDSDEMNCTNHFKCITTGRYIPKTRKCDGTFDCLDLSDECNAECSSYIVENYALKALSWLVGVLAALANLTIISKNVITLKKCRTTVALFNKTLIMTISSGDFLVGCYLIVISVYDGIIYGGDYCKKQISWITSTNCSVIGVLSTLGSQLSLFAMCLLSATRIFGIWNSMKVPGEVTWVKSLQVTVGIVIMILSSLSIAAVPIARRFEDFFVNGIKYPEELKIFLGKPNKQEILAVLEAYYGRMKEASLSWKMIKEMVSEMFSHDFKYPDHTKSVSRVDFYGNDGVCLFKYFVKNQDPQRNFVWAILALNFGCFIFISVSYLVIGYISHQSSKSLTQSGTNRLILERNRKMNRKISIIILTDFLCWIPFIVICVLHSIEVLDATPWYSLFSIIILPINSVINPLIYDDTILSLICTPIRRLGNSVSNSRVFNELRSGFARQTTFETIDPGNFEETNT